MTNAALCNCSSHAQQLNGNVCMAWQDKGVLDAQQARQVSLSWLSC